MNDPFNLEAAQTDAPGAAEPARETTFPWPPAEEENVIYAAGETWRSSLFQPSAFFRAMPATGYLSGLAYYVPIGLIGAALELFWSSTFDALGIAWPLDSLWQREPPANPALERLLSFLLSPLTLLAALFVAAAIIHATLKLLGAARRPFVATTRVIAFSAGTELFLLLPVLGPLLAGVWSFVLIVIGLREVHGTSTGRALATVLIPAFLLGLALTTLAVLAKVLGITAP